jgi:hypothetical protein
MGGMFYIEQFKHRGDQWGYPRIVVASYLFPFFDKVFGKQIFLNTLLKLKPILLHFLLFLRICILGICSVSF